MRTKDLTLQEFHPCSVLVHEEHFPQRSKFPIIDVNNHFGRGQDWTTNIKMPYPHQNWTIPDLDAGIAIMDELNIRCAFNLDGGWGEVLQHNLLRYKKPHPNRFVIFAGVDWTEVDNPDFGEKWAKELEKSVIAGAEGLAVFKTLGLEFRDRTGQLIMPGDLRLEPIWAKAGELNIPVIIHTADPISFFMKQDETNERWEELCENPDWQYYGKNIPPFLRLINSMLSMVERNRNTIFIGAHVLGYSENLKFVAQALDRYPNLYIDIAERISELGRQPYSARKFLINYSDRILFGTDTFSPNRIKYQTYLRFLETEDEYFDYGTNQGRWKIYGLNLPDDTLRKIYFENANSLFLTKKNHL